MTLESLIPGVVIRKVAPHIDSRGWLIELFRDDETPSSMNPAMGYISCTKPGIARGPHEHVHQTDAFVFLDGEYELHLWENRTAHPELHEVFLVGEANQCLVFVPPGVVHAYRNIGSRDATVLNFPDKLYAGVGKKEPVDEIRHEHDAGSQFKL